MVELEPAGTVIDAGVVNQELPDVRLTAAPPVGARPDRMRVQVLEPAGAKLDGTQASEFGRTGGAEDEGGIRFNVAFSDAAPKEAVIVAALPAVTLEALALNVAEVDPAATTTDEGTVRLLLLLPTVTVTPPLGAAPLRLAVQLDVPGVVREDGLHVNVLRLVVELTVSVPPVAVAPNDPPAAVTANGLAMPVFTVPSEREGVMTTVATTPSAMPVEFIAAATHL